MTEAFPVPEAFFSKNRGECKKVVSRMKSEGHPGKVLLLLNWYKCHWSFLDGFPAAFSSVQKPVMWLWSPNHGPTGINTHRDGGSGLGSGFSYRDGVVRGTMQESNTKELLFLSSLLSLRETLSQLWIACSLALITKACCFSSQVTALCGNYYMFLLPLYIISF